MPPLQKSNFKKSDFALEGFEDLEISTQIVIKAALSRGIDVEVLNRSAHFLRLRKGDHVELIKEASKTSLDSYITFLIMEDKYVSKLLLEEAGIPVPRGGVFGSYEAALEELDRRQKQPTVIKPNSTNFGIGVRVFENGSSPESYRDALRAAFEHDANVIIEDFIPGLEYRFLILGKECVAVCRRVPANVRGDGISSIRELVSVKNRDVRRGRGHRTPLEKIDIDDTVLAHLASQGLSPDSVPKQGETIYLRKNSNISTGGDSIDETDRVHPYYSKLALDAARAANARICGVDIIARNIELPPAQKETDGAVLEINFNPVLYIHEYPFQGQPRQIGERLLDALGF